MQRDLFMKSTIYQFVRMRPSIALTAAGRKRHRVARKYEVGCPDDVAEKTESCPQDGKDTEGFSVI
jgi:hypothetical protein